MDEAFIKKVQPNSPEAEQSVIGAMIMDRDAICSQESKFWHGW